MNSPAWIASALCALGACSPEQPASRPCVAAFVRDDCPPCQLMGPWLAELAQNHLGEVDVALVNIDRPGGPELAAYFGVFIVPSQVYLDADGVVLTEHSGAASLDDMERRVQAAKRHKGH